eukprot:427563-Hanusia_phi.AAC.3
MISPLVQPPEHLESLLLPPDATSRVEGGAEVGEAAGGEGGIVHPDAGSTETFAQPLESLGASKGRSWSRRERERGGRRRAGRRRKRVGKRREEEEEEESGEEEEDEMEEEATDLSP